MKNVEGKLDKEKRKRVALEKELERAQEKRRKAEDSERQIVDSTEILLN